MSMEQFEALERVDAYRFCTEAERLPSSIN